MKKYLPGIHKNGHLLKMHVKFIEAVLKYNDYELYTWLLDKDVHVDSMAVPALISFFTKYMHYEDGVPSFDLRDYWYATAK